MFVELEVDEANFTDIVRIETHYSSMKISNELGIEVDEQSFIAHWEKMEGTGRIQKLIINYNSTLKNVRVLKAFPNVRILILYGQYLTTLEGIEWFKQGEYVNISTQKNHRRNLALLSQAQVRRIDLFVEREEDLAAIAACKHLTSLDLYGSMQVDITTWSNLPLDYVAFKRGKFREIGDTAAIPSLKDINFLGCRNLERFVGDNSQITSMIIDNCKKLDLRTIQTFKGAIALTVNGSPQEIGLTEMGEFKRLESLSLLNSKVQIDTADLKRQFPKLKELYISQLKKEQAIELKQSNPDIVFSGDSIESV